MIATAGKLRQGSRRLDRLNETAADVVDAMRHGQSLHCEFGSRGPNWKLSGGRYVAAAIAHLVTSNPSVIGVGDALFAGATSQTWRWARIRRKHRSPNQPEEDRL